MNWESFDPTWLVEAAKRQLPEERWLAESLARCTRCAWRSRAYVCFVDPSLPNEPGSEWQFEESIVIEDTEEGDLVLDVLKDQRIGGVEFLSRVRAEQSTEQSSLLRRLQEWAKRFSLPPNNR